VCLIAVLTVPGEHTPEMMSQSLTIARSLFRIQSLSCKLLSKRNRCCILRVPPKFHNRPLRGNIIRLRLRETVYVSVYVYVSVSVSVSVSMSGRECACECACGCERKRGYVCVCACVYVCVCVRACVRER